MQTADEHEFTPLIRVHLRFFILKSGCEVERASVRWVLSADSIVIACLQKIHPRFTHQIDDTVFLR